MPLSEQTIHRIYDCKNAECAAKIALTEKVGDPWMKTCPFCEQDTLLLDKAVLSLSGIVGMKNRTTLGSLSDENRRSYEKEHGKDKFHKDIPFWRKSSKLNMEILKNPQKYVETGHI